MTAIALRGHLDTYIIRNGHHPHYNNPPFGEIYTDTHAATDCFKTTDSREEQRWGLRVIELVLKGKPTFSPASLAKSECKRPSHEYSPWFLLYRFTVNKPRTLCCLYDPVRLHAPSAKPFCCLSLLPPRLVCSQFIYCPQYIQL